MRGGVTLHSKHVAQHRALASLGPPYVYNFDPRNWTSLGDAAERAVVNRQSLRLLCPERVHGGRRG